MEKVKSLNSNSNVWLVQSDWYLKRPSIFSCLSRGEEVGGREARKSWEGSDRRVIAENVQETIPQIILVLFEKNPTKNTNQHLMCHCGLYNVWDHGLHLTEPSHHQPIGRVRRGGKGTSSLPTECLLEERWEKEVERMRRRKKRKRKKGGGGEALLLSL